MAVPPQTVRIKRKKGDEPVESLYIHVEPQFKKRRFTDFVFRRVLEPEQDGVVPSVTSVQGLQARHRVASARTFAASSCEHTGEGSLKSIRRGEEDPPSLGSSLQSSPEPTVKDVSSAPMGLGELEDESNIIQTAISQYTRAPPIHNIRRFHLTRLLKPTPQGPTGGVQKLKRQRKGDATLLFEEVLSDSKLRTPRKDDRPRGADNDDTIRVALPPDQQSKTVTLNDAHLAENNPACIALPQSGTSSVDINTAADDLDVEMADLPGPLRDLLAEELKSRHPEQKPREPQLKYKPTAPAQRYRNRCDYVKIEVRSADKGDAIQEKDSDGDYIYDTYVREFREQSSGTNWPGKSIGVLVFDQETQAEWELLEEEKSDKDYNSDEEDSNAEDWYGNDYPEDDPDSRDDYEEGGSSDDGAFSRGDWDDGEAWSDGEGFQGSWKRPSQYSFGALGLDAGADDDDEDGF